MLTTLLSFIFVLGILVFIHELGHFLVAKKVGIKVERFSLGFPPNIFAKTWGETTYCIGVIPLGGYVKMAGEQPDEEATGSPDEFMSKTVLQRAAVIFAGPFMNYLLAMVLLISIFYFGGEPIVDRTQIVVGAVEDESPAAKAGLVDGDNIIALDGAPISNFDSLRTMINARPGEQVAVSWVRGNDTMSAAITTMLKELPNESGGMDTIGQIGFQQKITEYRNIGFTEAVVSGVSSTHFIVVETGRFIYRLISGKTSAKMLGGPIFIAQQSGKEAQKGASSLFFFMAVLSVNLAILNVLPIPVLDGGHLVFLFVEKIKGKPLSMKARATAQQVGMLVLLTLIVFVTYNDILRVIRNFG